LARRRERKIFRRVFPREGLDRLNSRLIEGFGAWPNWFSGKSRAELRLLARGRLLSLAERCGPGETARAARAAVAADARRADPHTWVGDVLAVAGGALRDHPPGDGDWQVRKEALLLLDCALNVRRGSRWRRDVGRFYQDFMARAVEEIVSSRPAEGLRLWKIYNMGFVVRSRRHCVGFDIHPGRRLDPKLTVEQMRALAGALDVAFVSHIHVDHLHTGFARMMLEAGKTVVLPASYRPWLRGPGVIRVYNDYRTPIRIGGIEARCYPGWQRLLARNCVYVVNLEGFRIAHNGDNTRQRLYRRLGNEEDLDVVLANCWSGMGRWADAADPDLLVTGHENEIGHGLSMRAPFRHTYDRLDRLGLAPGPDGPARARCEILSWGEGLHFRRDG